MEKGVAQTSLWELARLFLKLGTILFGGPTAHIPMMEDEVVRRRRWITREKFLDLTKKRLPAWAQQAHFSLDRVDKGRIIHLSIRCAKLR